MSSSIESYAVVQARNPDELTQRVNERIAAGWQPFGVMVIYDQALADDKQHGFMYCQPVVRYAGK
jgi:hypothetical protein